MSAALDIPALRREWRMSKALKDADLNKNIGGETAADNQARWDAIQSGHDERAGAIFAQIIAAENHALSIRDVWAVLNLALCVAEDDEDSEASRSLMRKAERALKALRHATMREPEPEAEEQAAEALLSGRTRPARRQNRRPCHDCAVDRGAWLQLHARSFSLSGQATRT